MVIFILPPNEGKKAKFVCMMGRGEAVVAQFVAMGHIKKQQTKNTIHQYEIADYLPFLSKLNLQGRRGPWLAAIDG